MRKVVKILHSLASCGLVGGLAAYMIVLSFAPQQNAAQYADMRETIVAIGHYVLVPSLGVALVTGLVAMIVHRAFQSMRWVWAKAALGLAMFEATLAIVQSKAVYAATVSRRIADGLETPEALKEAVASEWTALGAIMALSLAQIVLGVWRPALRKRSA